MCRIYFSPVPNRISEKYCSPTSSVPMKLLFQTLPPLARGNQTIPSLYLDKIPHCPFLGFFQYTSYEIQLLYKNIIKLSYLKRFCFCSTPCYKRDVRHFYIFSPCLKCNYSFKYYASKNINENYFTLRDIQVVSQRLEKTTRSFYQ